MNTPLRNFPGGHPRSMGTSREAVTSFWRPLGPAVWFGSDPDFRRRFREGFVEAHEAAAAGRLDRWGGTTEGALALCLLLDQFPRNAFRGSPRMFATDGAARDVARMAIAQGMDRALDGWMPLFLYLPLCHSEDLSDQERAVELCDGLPDPCPMHARRQRDIVQRFGRFPSRNAVLGRTTTVEERAFLDAGGFVG